MERSWIYLFKFTSLFCKIYSILLTFRCTQYQMQVLGNIWGYTVSLNHGISFHAEKYLRSLHSFPIKNISEIYSQIQCYCIVPPFKSNACTLFTAYTECLTFTQLHVPILIMYIKWTATVHLYIWFLKFVNRRILQRSLLLN
jgi:hypothetical protein